MTEAVVVLSTVADPEAGAALIRELLGRRLIACGTILPGARSIYNWQGSVTDASESVLLLKTGRANVDTLRAAFQELHPYDVPEFLALPVAAGLDSYLAWLAQETR